MKNKLFDTREELLDYFFEQLNTEDNITLVVDRIMAEKLSNHFDEDDFEDLYSICISDDIDEYYVEKIENKVFCIEHARYEGKYLEGEVDKLIVMEKFMNDKLLEANEVKEVIVVDIEEDIDECSFDILSEAHKEYIDEHIGVLLKYGIPECETRNLLAEIVQTMYLDGEKDCLLNWSKIFKELAEDDGEE